MRSVRYAHDRISIKKALFSRPVSHIVDFSGDGSRRGDEIPRSLNGGILEPVPDGIPTAEILNEAATGNYSLIVMGGQGKGYIRELFLGSMSHNIARNAGVSLLLIPAIR